MLRVVITSIPLSLPAPRSAQSGLVTSIGMAVGPVLVVKAGVLARDVFRTGLLCNRPATGLSRPAGGCGLAVLRSLAGDGGLTVTEALFGIALTRHRCSNAVLVIASVVRDWRFG